MPRHPNIPLPRDLYRPQRENSRGHRIRRARGVEATRRRQSRRKRARGGKHHRRDGRTGSECGDLRPRATDFKDLEPDAGRARARPCWRRPPICWKQRAAHFIALLQREGGKTLDDALSEVREAVDFCRYYAAEGRELFGDGKAMPGPTGESNVLRLRGRGVFVAISPWNFPLAIFLGQVTAALMAGNAVVAKPAEQTPLIAARGRAAVA